MTTKIKFIDCTLRDGGYYNNWDFQPELVADYLNAMQAINIDFVEIGFRFSANEGFKGAHAFSTDEYVRSLQIPASLLDKIGVMVNGADLLPKDKTQEFHSFQKKILNRLFKDKADSPVTLVRIACHAHEFENCMPAVKWLKKKGYIVGINLMQIANFSDEEISLLASRTDINSVDILYFADSMGSLNPERTKGIVKALKIGWKGELGIHAHDNMGQAIANTVEAVGAGANWVDSTVTGMGRGPGNAQTEYLILTSLGNQKKSNPTKLFEVVRKYFKPLQNLCGWGTNPYYYLAGKFGIHPTFIQEMLADSRFSDEDIIAVIDQLKIEGGKNFNKNTLTNALNFYSGEPIGSWSPFDVIQGREVLILGAGPSITRHRNAIEAYIKKNKPFVIALNTQRILLDDLIDVRAACHPVRLMADFQEHLQLNHPLIAPASMLPEKLRHLLVGKKMLDYGIEINEGSFNFKDKYCSLSTPLVAGYALAIGCNGRASRILLAGFDGYGEGDSRTSEMNILFRNYDNSQNTPPIFSITPTQYQISVKSVYSL